MVALRPLDKKMRKLGMASNLRVVVDISSSRRSVLLALIWGVGNWMLRSLTVICLCYRYYRSHVGLYCVRSVRVSSSSDR